MKHLSMQRELRSHSSAVNGLAFHPHGRFLASGGQDDAHICLWDGTTFAAHALLHGHTDWIVTLGWSADGHRIGSFSADHTMRLWDPATGHAVAVVTSTSSIERLRFAPRDPLLATAHRDGHLSVWDAETGAVLRTWRAHPMAIDALAWSPDGAFLVSGGRDGIVRIWDWTSGREHGNLVFTDRILALAWAPDDAILAIGHDETVSLWHDRHHTMIQEYRCDDSISDLAWSPDGTMVAATSFRDAISVRVWDGSTGDLRWEVASWNDYVTSVAFHPTQAVLAVGSGGRWDGYIELYPLLPPRE